MEFDDHVLSEIRAFSRPQMQFVNEWAAARRAIVENHLVVAAQFQADVKEKLFTPEAANYMEIFVPYIAAAVAANRFTRVRDGLPSGSGCAMTSEDWVNFKFWVQLASEAMDERHKLHKKLLLMLYGPPDYIESDDEYMDDE
jgi:hypothetical protein